MRAVRKKKVIGNFVESDLKWRGETDCSGFLNVDTETRTLNNLSVSLAEKWRETKM